MIKHFSSYLSRVIALSSLSRPMLAIAVGLSLVVPVPMHAQNGLGAIQGTITDSKGALIPDADVTVTNTETGVSLHTHTNDRGLYNVPSLVPGDRYKVVAERAGFESINTFPVSTTPGGTTTIDATLPVGKENVSITVEADAQLLERGSGTQTTNLDQQLTENLPYPEQSSLEVALLAPGVKGAEISPQGLVSENPGIYTGSVIPGAQISINGVSAGHAAILVDGSDVTQTSYARSGITVSSGMVGQTTVITSGVPAQYGRTLGGVIIQSTRSGTSGYHGRISWRHTDPSMQAWPDGQTVSPNLHQNFFGLFLGGPVRIPHLYDGRNKTFFFASFEPARLRNKTSVFGQIPIPDELKGKFHDDFTLLDPAVIASSGIDAARNALRIQGLHYQSARNAQGFPTGPLYSASSKYELVPNDDLSAQFAQNPFASFLGSQFPTPATPANVQFLRPDGYYIDSSGNNVSEIRGVLNSDNRYSIRLDHSVGSDRIYGRFSATPLSANRFGVFDINSPLTPWQQDTSHAYDAIIDETHIIHGSVVNEFKFSFLRNDQNRLPPAAAMSKDWAGSLGLTPSSAGVGFPSLTGFGYNVGTSTVQRNVDVVTQVQDDIRMIAGRHSLMLGGDIRHLQANLYNTAGIYGGNYSFSANQTSGCQLSYYSGSTKTCSSGGGIGFASIALGLINTFSNQTSQVPGYYRWHYYGGYFQDNWRILPTLTLNLGLRYEFETPRMEINDNQGTFVPSIQGTLNGTGAMGAFCFTNSCGLGHTLFPANYTGFEPRVGFALALGQRATMRGSYSLLRAPLTGLGNYALPNFGVTANAVSATVGGTIPNQPVDFITNPVSLSPVSALSALGSVRGPFFTVPSGVAIPYVRQTNAVPYSQQWSFGFQVQIERHTIIEVTYSGSHSVHMFNNDTAPQNIPSISVIQAAIAAHADFSKQLPNPYGIQQNGAVTKETYAQSLLPFQNFFNQPAPGVSGGGENIAEIGELYNRSGSGSYNALYLSGTHRFGQGLSLQASFTWSKSMDSLGTDAAGSASYGSASSIQNPFDLSHERSVSDYDIPAYVRVGYSYQLPFGVRQHYNLSTHTGNIVQSATNWVANTVLGDVSTGGIFRAESSTPFLPTLGTTTIQNTAPGWWFSQGGGNSALPIGYNPRPNVNPSVSCINPNWGTSAHNRWTQPYINAAAFSVPGTLDAPQFGNAPRTMANCRGPREIFFDANLDKTFPIGKNTKRNLRLGIQAFNVFNHPLFYFNGGTTNNSQGNNGKIFSSCSATTLTCAVSPVFGTVNAAFTSQFSRYLQVQATFTF